MQFDYPHWRQLTHTDVKAGGMNVLLFDALVPPRTIIRRPAYEKILIKPDLANRLWSGFSSFREGADAIHFWAGRV